MLSRTISLRVAPAVLLTLAFATSARAQGQGKLEGAETRTTSRGTSYLIRIPKTYDKEKGAVLAVSFYGGVKADYKSALTELAYQKAWGGEAILVAPDSIKGSGWQPSAQGDVAAIGDLLRDLQKELRPTRTFVTGFAEGSNMAFAVALAFPDLVSVSIPQAGDSFLPLAEGGGKKPVFYVVLPDGADKKENTLATIKKLQNAGLTVEVDKPKGDGRSDPEAVGRGIVWADKVLGKAVRPLTDAEGQERLAALEKAVKDKDAAATKTALAALAGAPRKVVSKVAAICTTQCESSDDDVALAAIELAGSLGEDGVKVVKKVPAAQKARAKAAAAALAATHSPKASEQLLAYLKSGEEEVAVSAAKELGNLGGEAALAALVAGLEKAEGPSADGRKAAIIEALTGITGRAFATSKEWKKWMKERS